MALNLRGISLHPERMELALPFLPSPGSIHSIIIYTIQFCKCQLLNGASREIQTLNIRVLSALTLPIGLQGQYLKLSKLSSSRRRFDLNNGDPGGTQTLLLP